MQLPSGASHLVVEGSLRDSLGAVVTNTPGSFWTTTPPAAGQGHVDAKLAGRFAVYPAGTEL